MTDDQFVSRGLKEKHYSAYSLQDQERLLKEAYRLIQAKLNSYLPFEGISGE
jgi:hypothetical protein